MASILSDSTVSQDDTEVTAKITEAYVKLIANQEHQAIRMYKQIIQENPRCWRAYQNLGVAYIMTKDFEEAYKVLKTYVQHVPKDPLGHDSLGVTYSELDDPLQAIASFVNSINLSPTYHMSYYNLGVVLGKLGLYEIAFNVYQKSLQFYPTYVNAMNNIADIYKRFDNIEAAIQMFKKIIQIDPTYVLAIKNLGNCYLLQKKYLKALMTYFKFRSVSFERPDILMNISLCLDYYGLYSEAAYFLKKAYQLNADEYPFNITSLYSIGNFYEKQFRRNIRYMRYGCRCKQPVKSQITDQFYETFFNTIEFYQEASKKFPQFRQSQCNAMRTNFNYVAALSKLGISHQNFPQLKRQLEVLPDSHQIKSMIDKIQPIIKQIQNWEDKLRTLLTFPKKKKITKKKEKYLKEQSYVYEIFRKSPINEKNLKFNKRTYISRSYRHNLNRLILKRCRFVKRFNQINKKMCEFFKYKKMITVLQLNSANETNENGQKEQSHTSKILQNQQVQNSQSQILFEEVQRTGNISPVNINLTQSWG